MLRYLYKYVKMKFLAGFVFTVVLLLNGIPVMAQSLKTDSIFVPGKLRQYQFQLDESVESIDQLRYDQSGEPINGKLSPDGRRVVMDNYKKGQRVKLTVTYADGRSEEVTKSSCYIDPVTYEL